LCETCFKLRMTVRILYYLARKEWCMLFFYLDINNRCNNASIGSQKSSDKKFCIIILPFPTHWCWAALCSECFSNFSEFCFIKTTVDGHVVIIARSLLWPEQSQYFWNVGKYQHTMESFEFITPNVLRRPDIRHIVSIKCELTI